MNNEEETAGRVEYMTKRMKGETVSLRKADVINMTNPYAGKWEGMERGSDLRSDIFNAWHRWEKDRERAVNILTNEEWAVSSKKRNARRAEYIAESKRLRELKYGQVVKSQKEKEVEK